MKTELLCLLAMIAGVAGCDTAVEPSFGEGEPAQVGSITNRDTAADQESVSLRILVLDAEDQECGIWWSITPDTRVTRGHDEAFVDVPLGDLVVGTRVAVWTDFPILDSCPAQGGAVAVEILSP